MYEHRSDNNKIIWLRITLDFGNQALIGTVVFNKQSST